MRKVVAIIQARMGSTRLPGKVMLDLYNGRPVLWYMIKRLQAAKFVDQVMVATSLAGRDNEIEDYCKLHDVNCFRGDEADVLRRVWDAAGSVSASKIVDVTGDCPLVDPRHVDSLIMWSDRLRAEYVSNIDPRTWPDGLDVQVYYTKILGQFVHGHHGTVNREHTGWNILQYKRKFRTGNLPAPDEYRFPEWGLTLDTAEDYTVLKWLFKVMMEGVPEERSPWLFPVEDVLDYIRRNPMILGINRNVQRKVPEDLG